MATAVPLLLMLTDDPNALEAAPSDAVSFWVSVADAHPLAGLAKTYVAPGEALYPVPAMIVEASPLMLSEVNWLGLSDPVNWTDSVASAHPVDGLIKRYAPVFAPL